MFISVYFLSVNQLLSAWLLFIYVQIIKFYVTIIEYEKIGLKTEHKVKTIDDLKKKALRFC